MQPALRPHLRAALSGRDGAGPLQPPLEKLSARLLLHGAVSDLDWTVKQGRPGG